MPTPNRPSFTYASCMALALCLPLCGCFADAGLSAAQTATMQAAAAKNAVKMRDDAMGKIKDSMALEASRNAKLLDSSSQDGSSTPDSK